MRLRIADKRDPSFYDLFDEFASNEQPAAEELLDLLKNTSDVGSRAKRIFEIEHQADELARDVIHRLAAVKFAPCGLVTGA